MSLPHFKQYGWEPHVLAVSPEPDQVTDPLLVETLPSEVDVHRVAALPKSITELAGVGNLALRALPALYSAGRRILQTRKIDVAYFSTTMFFSMPLARMWRRETGIPYVLDIQDPWYSDYYDSNPAAAPPKYGIVRRLHRMLERWTMKDVAAIIAVSPAYVETLRRRYQWITPEMCTTLPFGASSADFDVLGRHPQINPCFQKRDSVLHGVYLGRAGDDMRPALQILFDGLLSLRTSIPEVFRRMDLHFVGTSYAIDSRARKTVEPIAGPRLSDVVQEQTSRVPYFQGLQLLKDADFLVLIGSDDPSYSASKAYPYLMSGKRILAVLHGRSPLVPTLRQSGVATVVTFNGGDHDEAVTELVAVWPRMMKGLASPARADPQVLEAFSANEMTRRQCAVFEWVLDSSRTAAA